MKEFEPISNLLQAALPPGEDSPAPEITQQKLVCIWHEQLGAAGLHSRPLLFTSGRLVVFTQFASWGSEIRNQTQGLMQALSAHDIFVTGIEVKIRPELAWLQSIPPARKTRKPTRMSLENAEQIRLLAEKIDHPRLKKSLLRLSRQSR
jgi:hypothetical protein